MLTMGQVLSVLHELIHFNPYNSKEGHCYDFSLQVRKLRYRAVFSL